MGYYTNFELSILDKESRELTALDKTLLEDEIDKMDVFDGGNIDDGYYTYAKWYDYDEDMALLSARFPGIVFYLHGDGEETTDIWDAYFLDGAGQFCPATISYDPFDRSRLKSYGLKDLSSQKYTYQRS